MIINISCSYFLGAEGAKSSFETHRKENASLTVDEVEGPPSGAHTTSALMFRGSRGDKVPFTQCTHVTHACFARYARCPEGKTRRAGVGSLGSCCFQGRLLPFLPFKRKEVKTFFNEIQFAKRTH